MKITSPGDSRTSARVSPRSRRSYRSSVVTSSPLRFSWMFRSEPMGLIPPLANRALVMVDRLLTVYEPGRAASPSTKTRMERNSPSVTLAFTPIICWLTRSRISSRSSWKVRPVTVTGPSRGKVMLPSRLTTSSYVPVSLPNSCTLTTSPGPST
jgi:hypothetical protein